MAHEMSHTFTLRQERDMAERQAETIGAYWEQRGFKVKVEAAQIREGAEPIVGVKSNLKDGLPR